MLNWNNHIPNCFLKTAAWSVNPLDDLLNELGPADVGVSLIKDKRIIIITCVLVSHFVYISQGLILKLIINDPEFISDAIMLV